jgi:hypothetical protein
MVVSATRHAAADCRVDCTTGGDTVNDFARDRYPERLDTIKIQDDTIKALRAEVQAYRELPLVTPEAHRLACDARDRALAELDVATREAARYRTQLAEYAVLVDSMTAELADLRDKRNTVALKRALRLLQDVMHGLRSYTGAPKENALHAEARAFLAEQGCRRVDTELDAANEQWLAGEGRR